MSQHARISKLESVPLPIMDEVMAKVTTIFE
jgi:hypothetical protein